MKSSLSNRCKTRSTLLALGLSLSFSALAQTGANVTLYGIIDQSLRFTNNRSDSGGTHLEVANGAITNSRWGLRGQEDLGNGLKALFNLESGFEPHTGSLSDSGGRMFNRYAWVGLADDHLGTFMLGRNGAEAFNFFGNFDPLTVGGYAANSWPFFMTVGRRDNMASYAGQFGGLKIGVGYGFKSTYNNNAFDYRGARASYETGALAFGATWQENRGANDKVQRMWGAAASYQLPDTKVFLGYMGGRDYTGDVDGALNHATRTPSVGNFIANPRKDMTFFTGLIYTGAAPWSISGALYYNDSDNINGVKDNDGKRYTAAVVAEYNLSKRTQVYGTVDYNRVTNGANTELPGKNKQTGLGVGLRHIF